MLQTQRRFIFFVMISGIAEGGYQRLRKAIEAEVRKKHQPELDAVEDKLAKAAIEETIKREIKERMKEYNSPYSLWSSP